MNGIVFVIDGTDERRMEVVKEQIENMNKNILSKMPVVFLINKQDKEECLTKEVLKSYLDLERLSSLIKWEI